MDCLTAQDHLAAWLDDELSPSARTLLARHLASCPGCSALCDALADQELSPPDLDLGTGAPDFWAPLDRALDQTWSELPLRAASGASPAGPASPGASGEDLPWYRRSVRLPLPAVVAWAAAGLLMAGWMLADAPAHLEAGAAQPSSVASAEADATPSTPSSLRAHTAAALPASSWSVATYTPHRGTF